VTAPESELFEAFGRYERTRWGEVASVYAGSFGRVTALAVDPLLDAARVGKGARVLDVACGPGFAAIAAASRGASVEGVDFAPGMVAEAVRACPQGRFQVAEAAKLPFEPLQFDAVVSNFGVQHFPDPERALTEMFRVLKNGGLLAFTVWDAPEHSPAQRLLQEAVAAHGSAEVALPAAPPLHRFADAGETRRVLESAGFTGVTSSALPLVLRAASADEVFDIFQHGTVRLGAMLRVQPPPPLARIRDAFARSLEPYRSAAGVEVPMQAVLNSARSEAKSS
jgi:ubiquinone/menaquinone biosynthesis C-methylase UbiE